MAGKISHLLPSEALGSTSAGRGSASPRAEVGGARRRGELGKDLPRWLCSGAPAPPTLRVSLSKGGKGTESHRAENAAPLPRLLNTLRGHRRSLLRPPVSAARTHRRYKTQREATT